MRTPGRVPPRIDVFLLAAMVHTLFAEQLVSLGTVADWVAGVAEVGQAVAPFTPEAVAPRCGLGADTIRALTRTLAATPKAAVYARIGTCTQEYGTLASLAPTPWAGPAAARALPPAATTPGSAARPR